MFAIMPMDDNSNIFGYASSGAALIRNRFSTFRGNLRNSPSRRFVKKKRDGVSNPALCSFVSGPKNGKRV